MTQGSTIFTKVSKKIHLMAFFTLFMILFCYAAAKFCQNLLRFEANLSFLGGSTDA